MAPPHAPRPARAASALLALLAVALVGCTGGPGPAGEQVGPLVGNLAPPVGVETIDGEAWSLAQQRGKVVILDLMGVNCPPCRAQMPHLQAVADAHEGDAAFAMLSIDMASVYPGLGARNEQEIVAFRDEFNATWPFAPDRQGQVGRGYEPIAIPTLVLIGPDGVIRYKHSGGVITAEDIEAEVAEHHPGTAENPEGSGGEA